MGEFTWALAAVGHGGVWHVYEVLERSVGTTNDEPRTHLSVTPVGKLAPCTIMVVPPRSGPREGRTAVTCGRETSTSVDVALRMVAFDWRLIATGPTWRVLGVSHVTRVALSHRAGTASAPPIRQWRPFSCGMIRFSPRSVTY